MRKQKIKMFLAGLVVFVAVFAVTTFIKAAATDSVSGWLWGGSDSNIGWISANNTNMAGVVSYGLNIPAADGNLSGYAWSENIGAMAFDNSGGYLTGCPSGTCSARRVGDNLEGWARFVEIKKALDIGNSGGWQGWIKLNPTNGGVTIDPPSGNLGGYAWSDELGWIDFSKAKIGPIITPPTGCTSPKPPYTCINPEPECPATIGTVSCVDGCGAAVDMSNCSGCSAKTTVCSERKFPKTNYREVAP
jgi:hypothetical protein